MYSIFNGDCFEHMKNLDNSSIDLILCDPPYGTIKTMGKDRASGATTKDTSWDDIVDIDQMFKECARVLKKGRKMVLFCQEPFTSKLISTYNTFFTFNYKMIWKKNSAGNILGCKRNHVNLYEEILVFTKKYDSDSYPEVRKYAKKIRDLFTYEEIVASGLYTKTQHFISHGAIQFHIPSEENYIKLTDHFELKEKLGDDFIDYKTLRDLKNSYDYKSVFNLWEGTKTKSNILEYAKPTKPVHPTQKPIDLLEDIIKTFSNQGDTVLDFTMGSGSTGVAALNSGRRFVGIEKLEEFFEISKNRIEQVKY